MLYVIYAIISLLILVIIIPLRVELKYNISTNFDKSNELENINISNYIDIYILKFIKVKRVNISEKQKTNKSKNKIKLIFDTVIKLILDFLNYRRFDDALLNQKDLKKINDSLYYKKMDINIGLNLQDVIINAYAISLVNAIINMYIAKNVDKFYLLNTEYNTYISNEIFNLKINSIIDIKLTNTIFVIIKIIFRLRKVEKENGRTTSDRKFNDDGYDFS